MLNYLFGKTPRKKNTFYSLSKRNIIFSTQLQHFNSNKSTLWNYLTNKNMNGSVIEVGVTEGGGAEGGGGKFVQLLQLLRHTFCCWQYFIHRAPESLNKKGHCWKQRRFIVINDCEEGGGAALQGVSLSLPEPLFWSVTADRARNMGHSVDLQNNEGIRHEDMAMRPMPWCDRERRTDAERDCKAAREKAGCRDAYLDKK